MLLRAFIYSLLFAASTSWAAIAEYKFNTEIEKQRFQSLTYELRCPKCQNQNIADSNAPIARDLKSKVQSLILEGRSDTEIVSYLVDRYGEFVRYKPLKNKITYLLWYGPFAFLLVGLIGLFFILRSQKKTVKKSKLSTEQQDKLQQLLKDKD